MPFRLLNPLLLSFSDLTEIISWESYQEEHIKPLPSTAASIWVPSIVSLCCSVSGNSTTFRAPCISSSSSSATIGFTSSAPGIIITTSSTILTFSFAVSVIVEVDFSTLWLAIFEKVGNWLTRLKENLDKIFSNGFVLFIVERSGKTFIPDASSAAWVGVSRYNSQEKIKTLPMR